ncbi:hypothetical protein GCM10020369_61690 [Cryptosporangium minutisporangium]|uniref:Uncharacterized protein n=1 Tax=Cryptosporangium minutisporangium TaxID=113569 RepID=A0ABP6T7U1_9ACTN
MTGWIPPSRQAEPIVLPMKPAPPVIKTFTLEFLPLCQRVPDRNGRRRSFRVLHLGDQPRAALTAIRRER